MPTDPGADPPSPEAPTSAGTSDPPAPSDPSSSPSSAVDTREPVSSEIPPINIPHEPEAPATHAASNGNAPFWIRAWRFMIGAPRSLSDRSIFHQLSLIPFLAWVGLG